MKKYFSIAGVTLAVASSLLAAEPDAPIAKGIPKIQFETNFFDFGKVSLERPMSGRFKFKNTGDAPLKVLEVLPSCDCTEAKAEPDTLAPGESGAITYTIKLDHAISAQRHITIHANDPQNPTVQLTVQFDFTPLYEVSPLALRLFLPAGKEEVQDTFTLLRKDGKALEIDRLVPSEKWITAIFDPTYHPKPDPGLDVSLEPEKNSARIIVTVHRPTDPPGLINATVAMWSSNFTDHPVRLVKVTGEIEAELTANPPRFYWVLADYGKAIKDYPIESLTRHVELRSVLGKPVEIKKAATNIKGLSVTVTPKDGGKTFDLAIKFDELPPKMVEGKVTIETSLASVPKLEVPMTIAPPF